MNQQQAVRFRIPIRPISSLEFGIGFIAIVRIRIDERAVGLYDVTQLPVRVSGCERSDGIGRPVRIDRTGDAEIDAILLRGNEHPAVEADDAVLSVLLDDAAGDVVVGLIKSDALRLQIRLLHPLEAGAILRFGAVRLRAALAAGGKQQACKYGRNKQHTGYEVTHVFSTFPFVFSDHRSFHL